MAKHDLRSICEQISQIKFKAVMVFKINRSFWDIIMVAKEMKMSNVCGIDREYDLFYNHK